MNVTVQSISSIFRQFLAILGIIFGILTQSVGALHLPTVASAWLGVGGVIVLAIEHYVSAPSTGTTATTSSKSVPPAP